MNERATWILHGLVAAALIGIACRNAHAQPIPLPRCLTTADTLASAQDALPGHDDVAGTIDGLAAIRFLDFANHHVGERTDYRGDGVVYAFSPEAKHAVIMLMAMGCATRMKMTLDASSFLDAVRAAYPHRREGT